MFLTLLSTESSVLGRRCPAMKISAGSWSALTLHDETVHVEKDELRMDIGMLGLS